MFFFLCVHQCICSNIAQSCHVWWPVRGISDAHYINLYFPRSRTSDRGNMREPIIWNNLDFYKQIIVCFFWKWIPYWPTEDFIKYPFPQQLRRHVEELIFRAPRGAADESANGTGAMNEVAAAEAAHQTFPWPGVRIPWPHGGHVLWGTAPPSIPGRIYKTLKNT